MSATTEVFSRQARAAIARESLLPAEISGERLERECAALAAHVRDDAAALAAFTGEPAILPLRRVRPGRADPHAAGPRVAELETAGGVALLFKPRSAAADHAFAAILDVLAGPSAALPQGLELASPAVLDCTTHSYARALAAAACADEAAVARAWRRTGRLLALLQRLGSRDAHRANVLFSGERPCLVDCEALLQPRLRISAGPADWPIDTALGTGLLGPRGYWRGGRARLTATLGIEAGAGAGRRASLPRLGAHDMAVSGYERDVLDGYREAWLHIDALHERLVAPGGPLDACEALPVRLLPRPTLLYRALVSRLATHRLDVAGVRERLRRWPVFGDVTAPWPWVEYEVEALRSGLVPMLTLAAGARRAGFGFDVALLAESALERAVRLLRGAASPPFDWHAGLVARCLALSAGAPVWQRYAAALEREPRAALAACVELVLRHRLELPDGRLAFFGVGAGASGAALLPRLAGLRRDAVGERLHGCLRAAARVLADGTLAACAERLAAQWPAEEHVPSCEAAAETASLTTVLARRRAATPYFDPVGEEGDLGVLAALCRANERGHV
ncbi:MAG: type 2 lantipeptide synthetase LanM [Gammaproteobacteria bacterium]|nr:type 2 lantipeptide synthetase LanM [Gammaproteobacteria bacterium]